MAEKNVRPNCSGCQYRLTSELLVKVRRAFSMRPRHGHRVSVFGDHSVQRWAEQQRELALRGTNVDLTSDLKIIETSGRADTGKSSGFLLPGKV